MRKIVRSIIASSMGMLLLSPVTVLAKGLPAGLYAGIGDGETTVLRVLPGGEKVILGATHIPGALAQAPDGTMYRQFYGKNDLKSYEAATKDGKGALLGSVQKTAENTYQIKFTQYGPKACYHQIKVTPEGLLFFRVNQV